MNDENWQSIHKRWRTIVGSTEYSDEMSMFPLFEKPMFLEASLLNLVRANDGHEIQLLEKLGNGAVAKHPAATSVRIRHIIHRVPLEHLLLIQPIPRALVNRIRPKQITQQAFS